MKNKDIVNLQIKENLNKVLVKLDIKDAIIKETEDKKIEISFPKNPIAYLEIGTLTKIARINKELKANKLFVWDFDPISLKIVISDYSSVETKWQDHIANKENFSLFANRLF